MVAFSGHQDGAQLTIMWYTGGLGYIDGTKVRPFHGTHPGSTCIVPGVAMQQRPIFVIQ